MSRIKSIYYLNFEIDVEIDGKSPCLLDLEITINEKKL